MEVGILHPGLMGETLAKNCSEPTLWLPQGRSPQTRARAESNAMVEVDSMAALCERADVIISICPPGAAESVAAEVGACGFAGCYVDANAISPDTSRRIAARFDRYVDGSVIGPPAHKRGTTRLYLSGEDARAVGSLFGDGVLDARVIDGGVGAASALKMAYASWTKIGSSLQLAIRALAEVEGVADALVEEWNVSQPGLLDRSEQTARRVSPKAWRFQGEMHQIAATYDERGLPTGFADAAQEIYRRLAHFKGTADPMPSEVIASLAPGPPNNAETGPELIED